METRNDFNNSCDVGSTILYFLLYRSNRGWLQRSAKIKLKDYFRVFVMLELTEEIWKSHDI